MTAIDFAALYRAEKEKLRLKRINEKKKEDELKITFQTNDISSYSLLPSLSSSSPSSPLFYIPNFLTDIEEQKIIKFVFFSYFNFPFYYLF